MEKQEHIEMTEQKEITAEVFEVIEFPDRIVLYIEVPAGTKVEVGDKFVLVKEPVE